MTDFQKLGLPLPEQELMRFKFWDDLRRFGGTVPPGYVTIKDLQLLCGTRVGDSSLIKPLSRQQIDNRRKRLKQRGVR